MPGIEATVNSAIDPIRLAGDCLSDTALYIETEVREAIEETLANNGVIITSSASSSSTAANSTSNTTASALSGNTAVDGTGPGAAASDETGASTTASANTNTSTNTNTNTASRILLACPVSYSKQFSLASTRISGSCSTFRAVSDDSNTTLPTDSIKSINFFQSHLRRIQTQASLRYYGGARKTAYQLDLFVHKFALPTSTALHKRGQEFSAANKWLKKLLNNNTAANESGTSGRMLENTELIALKRAGQQLRLWAEGLRIHADIVSRVFSFLFLSFCYIIISLSTLQVAACPHQKRPSTLLRITVMNIRL
jgi:hypothetical protein